MTARLYYCPWCSFRHTSLQTLVEHKAREHPYQGRPPEGGER